MPNHRASFILDYSSKDMGYSPSETVRAQITIFQICGAGGDFPLFIGLSQP
jgi:hypothetical protein